MNDDLIRGYQKQVELIGKSLRRKEKQVTMLKQMYATANDKLKEARGEKDE